MADHELGGALFALRAVEAAAPDDPDFVARAELGSVLGDDDPTVRSLAADAVQAVDRQRRRCCRRTADHGG